MTTDEMIEKLRKRASFSLQVCGNEWAIYTGGGKVVANSLKDVLLAALKQTAPVIQKPKELVVQLTREVNGDWVLSIDGIRAGSHFSLLYQATTFLNSCNLPKLDEPEGEEGIDYVYSE